MATVEDRLQEIEAFIAEIVAVLKNVDPGRNRSVREAIGELGKIAKKVAGEVEVVVKEVEQAVEGKPPIHGKGSSAEAWTAYAESVGLELPEDASKAEIIEAVEAHEAELEGE